MPTSKNFDDYEYYDELRRNCERTIEVNDLFCSNVTSLEEIVKEQQRLLAEAKSLYGEPSKENRVKMRTKVLLTFIKK